MRFLRWLKDRFGSRATTKLTVLVDDDGVTCHRGNLIESVTWDDLQRVKILTTDQGPFIEDVFYVLFGTEDGCVVPHGAAESTDLLGRLQALPGFDNEAVVDAMTCVENNEFECWEREHS